MNAEPDQSPLLSLRLAEAQSLLNVNQQRRMQAENAQMLVIVLSLSVSALAVATDSARVLLLLPPTALLLTSLIFQHYAEVTVLGSARAQLEWALNETAGGIGLFYELAISPVRKSAPLVAGVRVLQGLARGATAIGVAIGFVVVAGEKPLVIAAYSIVTVATTVSCVLSYRNMRQAAAVAGQAFPGVTATEA